MNENTGDNIKKEEDKAVPDSVDDSVLVRGESPVPSARAPINEAENGSAAANERPAQTKNDIPTVNAKANEEKSKIKKLTAVLCALSLVIGGISGGVVSAAVVRASKSFDSAEKSESDADLLDSAGYSGSLADNGSSDDKDSDDNSGAEAPKSDNSGSSGTTSQSGSEVGQTAASSKVLSASEIYDKNVNSVVSIESKMSEGTGYGTGFVISDKGYIVTNYHVVSGAASVHISFYDDSSYDAKIVGYEENNDIAVLKIEPEGEIKSVTYGVSSNLKVGDPVYIIGNPLGDLTFTLTSGVISALNRLIRGEDGMAINMFQTDAAVNNGNSGGPVFNAYGNVVGIASAKYASSSIEGLGFCIPIDDVLSMIDEIISKGYVSGKPLMGVSVYDKVVSTYGFIQSTKSINGAKVAAVGSGTAASKAGIQVGDVITALDGETVDSVSTLRTLLSSYRSGDTANVTLYSGSTEKTVAITFDEYEPADARTDYSNVYDL